MAAAEDITGRGRYPWLVPVLLVLVLAIAAPIAPRLIDTLAVAENRVTDFRRALKAVPREQHPDIVFVAIDEDTLAQFPYRSPLDRRFLGEVLFHLLRAGVKAVGVDLLLDQPTESKKDAILAQVMAAYKVPLVIGLAGERDGLTKKQATYLRTALAKADKALVNLVTDDRDGIVRFIYGGRVVNGTALPGFAGALARAVNPGIDMPAGNFPLLYRPGPDAATPPFKTFPAQTVKHLPAAWLKDKIVIIGANLPHIDRHPTPAASLFGAQSGLIPGALIHAHALAQILDGTQPPQIPPWSGMGVAAILAAIALSVTLWSGPATVRLLIGVATVAGFVLCAYLWPGLKVVTPALGLLIALMAGAALAARRQRLQRRFIEGAFSRFVAPTVIAELQRDPSRLQLGGERREISLVFTDVAGFTTLSEQLAPEDLVFTLNRYLSGMADVVLAHGGTLDKYIGDAVVTFFGAPLDQPDHARRALTCARDLDIFAQGFVDQMDREGLAFGLTRIGVHTGAAVVGNIGSNQHLDYTSIGDTVNTAARLESLNKHLGTRVAASAAVVAAAGDDIRTRPVGDLVLKGRTQPLSVREIVPDAIDDGHLAAYRKAYDGLSTEPAALDLFAALCTAYPDDGLAAFHRDRLTDGQSGTTIVMKSK